MQGDPICHGLSRQHRLRQLHHDRVSGRRQDPGQGRCLFQQQQRRLFHPDHRQPVWWPATYTCTSKDNQQTFCSPGKPMWYCLTGGGTQYAEAFIVNKLEFTMHLRASPGTVKDGTKSWPFLASGTEDFRNLPNSFDTMIATYR